MAVKIITENVLGKIESYQWKFKKVYRSIAIDEVTGKKVTIERLRTVEEAKHVLWENRMLNKEIEDSHTLHYYNWGNEPSGKVSAWVNFHNGDWMSLDFLSDCIVGSEDWTKECPYG